MSFTRIEYLKEQAIGLLLTDDQKKMFKENAYFRASVTTIFNALPLVLKAAEMESAVQEEKRKEMMLLMQQSAGMFAPAPYISKDDLK